MATLDSNPSSSQSQSISVTSQSFPFLSSSLPSLLASPIDTTELMEEADTADIFDAIVNRAPGTGDLSLTKASPVPVKAWTIYSFSERTVDPLDFLSSTSETVESNWIDGTVNLPFRKRKDV